MRSPSPFMCGIYFGVILVLYGLAGGSDYDEARKLECASKTTPATLVSWDSQSDSCKKEPQNGKAN